MSICLVFQRLENVMGNAIEYIDSQVQCDEYVSIYSSKYIPAGDLIYMYSVHGLRIHAE